MVVVAVLVGSCELLRCMDSTLVSIAAQCLTASQPCSLFAFPCTGFFFAVFLLLLSSGCRWATALPYLWFGLLQGFTLVATTHVHKVGCLLLSV